MSAVSSPASRLALPFSWAWRHRLVFATSVASAGAVAGSALFGAGWYFANQLEAQGLAVDHSPDRFDFRVAAFDGTTVALERPAGRSGGSAGTPGTFGLQWDGGYAQVTKIVSDDGHRVVREVHVLQGTLQPGESARIDSFAFPGDPMQASGLPFTDLTINDSLGSFPAWLVAAPGDQWVVMVHGKGANRREMLRYLPTLHAAGFNALVITYRNDEGLPADPSGLYRYGATEWQELDAAVAFALGHGARRIVLEGNSMGGALVMSFLEHSPRASAVDGLILDSPLLDFGATVSERAPSNVPPPMIRLGKWVSSRRFGVDWDALDYLRLAPRLTVPVLLFHGTGDSDVPIATSDRLAALRPDIVAYHRLDGVGHVRAWNAGPGAYDEALRIFLAQFRE